MRRTVWAMAAIGAVLSAPAAAHHDDPAEEAHDHHLSVILGGTSVLRADHTAITYGFDYEYALSPHFGVGLVVERAQGAIDATSLIAVVDVHVVGGLVLQLGPGVEFEGEEEIAIGRFGAYYEFEWETDWGEVTLAPTVSYDLSEEDDAVVFGLLIGRQF